MPLAVSKLAQRARNFHDLLIIDLRKYLGTSIEFIGIF